MSNLLRHFLSLRDFTATEFSQILNLALQLKAAQKAGEAHPFLAGKTLGMIFQKPSNRTRLSFEVGMYQLGGHALNIRPNEISMGDREPIEDVAEVFSRFVDMVMIRANLHQDIVTFAQHSSVPVINGLSDLSHPCQAMADLLTIVEKKGELAQLKVVYVGDGNNVCNSLINACHLAGGQLVVSAPNGYEPDGAAVLPGYAVEEDPMVAAKNADVIYTDVWTSMGQEAETEKRKKIFAPYQVNEKMMKMAKPDSIFMHCLPAHRGDEVSAEVMDSNQSVVFDQAENRMHAQKAIMVGLVNGFGFSMKGNNK